MKHAFKYKYTTPLLAVLCTFLWGSAFPTLKIGYELFDIAQEDVFSKIVFAGLRFFFAGFVVMLLNHCINPKDPVRFNRQYGKWIVALAVIGTAVQYFFFYIGVGNTTGVKGSIFATAGTFLVVLFAPLFFRQDRLTFLKVVGMLLGFFGILLSAVSSSGAEGLTLDMRFSGEGFLILAGLGDAGGTLIGKYLSDKDNPFHFSFFQMSLGGGILLVAGGLAGLLTGGIHLVFSIQGILLLAYAAALSGVAFSLWNLLLRYNHASTVTAFKFLIPVFGSLLSVLLLKEHFSLFIVLGLAASAAGIYLVNKERI